MSRKRPLVSVIDLADVETNQPIEKPTQSAPKRRYEGIYRTTLYIPTEVHEVIRRVAFDHRIKEHDIIMQGLELVLTQKYGMPSIHEIKRK